MKKRKSAKKGSQSKSAKPAKPAKVTKKAKKAVKRSPVTKSEKRAASVSTRTKAVAAKRTPAKTVSEPTRVTVREEPVTLRIYDVRDVPDHEHFYFVNGHRVRNVKELAEIMDKIEHEVFDYHVNEHRNDFYNWVSVVFKDLELAEKLLGVTGPKHLQFTIYKHVADKALKKRG